MSSAVHTSALAHRFAVIGGDGRMTHLCERLSAEGHAVSLFGCGNECFSPCRGAGEIRGCTTLEKAADGADAVILPLPASRDGVTVNCPRDGACTVQLAALAELLVRSPRLILLGGKLPEAFREAAQTLGVADRVVDYYENEVLLLRNAYVTAEAAVMTAMEHTDRILQGASVAILGYGRIGKYLARLLRAMGAEVTACARREESLFEAASEGCTFLRIYPDAPMNGLEPLCHRHMVLFNTIPSPVLSRELLTKLERNTLLIDLASAPFGVRDEDVREASASNGLRYLRAPSLPGSYAPRTAGEIIAECVLEYMTHREGGMTR
ncbi:MAG: NAD(P)-binding domain-containing protein [Clostridia bacterium]|nr:NAD(P)-binding domain-containing protein [Clostridia bacterium]